MDIFLTVEFLIGLWIGFTLRASHAERVELMRWLEQPDERERVRTSFQPCATPEKLAS